MIDAVDFDLNFNRMLNPLNILKSCIPSKETAIRAGIAGAGVMGALSGLGQGTLGFGGAALLALTGIGASKIPTGVAKKTISVSKTTLSTGKTVYQAIQSHWLTSFALSSLSFGFNLAKPLLEAIPGVGFAVKHVTLTANLLKLLAVVNGFFLGASLIYKTYSYTLYPLLYPFISFFTQTSVGQQALGVLSDGRDAAFQTAVDVSFWSVKTLFIQPILNLATSYLQDFMAAPFTVLGSLLGNTINFGVFVAPKVAWSILSSLDSKSWAFIAACIAINGYISSLSPPSLAMKFTPITYPSIIKKALLKHAETLLEPYKDNPVVEWVHKKLFSFPEQPILNASVEKEITAVKKGIFNARNNRDGVLSNLLLVGPPGTGKTMVAEKIAEEAGCNLVCMSGSSLQYFMDGKNTHITKFEEIFNFTQKNSISKRLFLPNRPTILFIDEIETFGKKQPYAAGRNNPLEDIQNLFKSKTGTPNNKVMVIGTTNHASSMDSAILSRFSSIIYLDKPDEAGRKKILEQYIEKFLPAKKIPERSSSLNSNGIARIAAQTKGLSGRELQYLALRLKQMRSQTDNNCLTEERLDHEVHTFLKQRRLVEPSSEGRLFDFVHFTVPKMKRAVFGGE